MEAIEFSPKNKKLRLVRKEIPKISSNEVLIKVAYAGVCGTDVHITTGEFPCQNEPFIMGHEVSGTIADIGKNITDIKIGDKVTMDTGGQCNACEFCHSGDINYCKNGGLNNYMGIFRDGVWAEYIAVTPDKVYKLPEHISLEQGVLLEPLSCLVHAWKKICPITVGKKVLILGAGIIGNLFACIFHVQGHRDVTISEPKEGRRKLLQSLGLGFDCVSPDVLKEKREENPHYLFDVVVDASGNGPAIEQAFTLLNHGGKICLFGCPAPYIKISISPYEAVSKEISLTGSFINPFCFPKAIGLMSSMGNRYIDFNKLGIQVFLLSEYEAALSALKQGAISKAVFKVYEERTDDQ